MDPDAQSILEIINSYYQSFCLASFFNLIIAAAGGIDVAVEAVLQQRKKINTDKNTQRSGVVHPKTNADYKAVSFEQHADHLDDRQQRSVRAESNPTNAEAAHNLPKSIQRSEPLPALITAISQQAMDSVPVAISESDALSVRAYDALDMKKVVRWLKWRRFMCYQVIFVKTAMSFVQAAIEEFDSPGSQLMMIPKVLGLVSIITALQALFSLYKILRSSGVLQQISAAYKLFWMKTQIGLEVGVQFLVQTIADNGVTLPGPDDYDKYNRATRILAMFTIVEAMLFMALSFWVLPADDSAVVISAEPSGGMQQQLLQQHNHHRRDCENCAFCFKSIVLWDLPAIRHSSPEEQQSARPPHGTNLEAPPVRNVRF